VVVVLAGVAGGTAALLGVVVRVVERVMVVTSRPVRPGGVHLGVTQARPGGEGSAGIGGEVHLVHHFRNAC
jgi:hypothetical protein